MAGALSWLTAVYRSYLKVEFLRFQWDILAVESGALGVLLALSQLPHFVETRRLCAALACQCVTLLCFKLMWGSCLCKLQSGCPEWNFGSAMAHHHRTTCLPKPLARPLHRWSGERRVSNVQGLMTLWAEGPLSILALSGCPWARAACCLLWCGLMLGIVVSGNYGFFNLLTCILSASLLDDQQLTPLARRLHPLADAPTGMLWPWCLWDGLLVALVTAAWALYTASTVSAIHRICAPKAPEGWCRRIEERLRALGLAGRYGLFARMTTSRDEVVLRELHRLPPDLAQRAVRDGLAVSAGEEFWVELALPFKPGPLNRAPPLLLNHMPRLDWQMWFVSLRWAGGEQPSWFQDFLQGLMDRKPSVLKLVAHPWQHEVQKFALTQRPGAIRVTLEDYDYNPLPDAKRKEGVWECGTWWCRRHALTDCEIHLP